MARSNSGKPTIRDAEIARKGAVADAFREQKPARTSPWKKVLKFGVPTAIIVTAAFGTTEYLEEFGTSGNVMDNIKGVFSHETISSFDINQLDIRSQALVVGKNAREVTLEEERSIVADSPLPELKIRVKPGENAPALSVLPSIDMSKAGKVDVLRKSTSGFPVNLCFGIENQGTAWGIAKYRGIDNIKTVEIYRLSDTNIMEKFNLGEDKYIFINIRGNFTLTDTMKDATLIDTDNPLSGNWFHDMLIVAGKNFNVDDKSELLTTINHGHGQKSIIIITPFYQDGQEGNPEPISPVVQDGDFLFTSPSHAR